MCDIEKSGNIIWKFVINTVLLTAEALLKKPLSTLVM